MQALHLGACFLQGLCLVRVAVPDGHIEVPFYEVLALCSTRAWEPALGAQHKAKTNVQAAEARPLWASTTCQAGAHHACTNTSCSVHGRKQSSCGRQAEGMRACAHDAEAQEAHGGLAGLGWLRLRSHGAVKSVPSPGAGRARTWRGCAGAGLAVLPC